MSVMDTRAHSKQSFDGLLIAVSKELSELLGSARFSLDEAKTNCIMDIIEQPEESRNVARTVETHAERRPPGPPPVEKSRLDVLLHDQDLFSIYNRFVFLTFITNIVLLLLAVFHHLDCARKNAALFSLGNVLLLVLVRNEILLRVVHELTVQIFGHSFVPLRLKLWVTHGLQNLGGIHAGCGISSTVWAIYALVQLFSHRATVPAPPIGILITVIVLLLISCFAALPFIRHAHHNVFENSHRICGWSALALIWSFIFLMASYDPTRDLYDFSPDGRRRLVHRLDIWFAAALTFLVFLPWALIKKVPVRTWIAPDKSLSLITCPDAVRVGLLTRVARAPLKDWHGFGAASDGFSEHTLICAAVGDFTKSLASDPPSHLWTRRVRFAGTAYLGNMYTRALFVATGSGLGPFLSFLMQPTDVDVHVIFIAKNIEKTYGTFVNDVLSRFPQEKLIVHDTATMGRPDVVKLVVGRVRECEAEVVFVTSNPAGSKKMVDGCSAAGIPAFMPIWDS